MTPPDAAGGHGAATCGAKKRQGEGVCALAAGWGTDHPGVGRCRLHGGNTSSHRAAAAREQAERLVATLGLPIATDPLQALMDEIARCAGHVAWLGEIVADLDREQVVRGVAKITDRGGERTTEVRSEINVWIRLYQNERDRLARVAEGAIRAGVAERHVQLMERQGALLAEIIRAILDDLGIDPEAEETRKVVRLHMARGSAEAA